MIPFFSVVVTVYNKSDFIENTVNSILNQSFENFEVIVINDGSTDNSAEIIKTFKDQRLKLITTKNQGASKSRNLGIKQAKCNYIALLDGDDIWDLNYLDYMFRAINTYPNQKIFTASVSQKYEERIIPLKYNINQNGLFGIHNYFEASKAHSIITSSSVVFHKSILEKTGLFDPSIVSGQDTDMWIRFGLFNEVVFINKVLATYNYNPKSLSNTTFKLKAKPKFDKYFEEERKDPLLKAHLDRNRYAMAILSKIVNDSESFNYYTSHISTENLGKKQRFLLKGPRWLLRFLLKLKSYNKKKLYYPES
ncbi:glycosyltransferase family A protein [Winogradskyella sp.]|uniref:glycosyltransferase family 2 protein n=1 Tax=Winogradskyella sp. TaxID=1883156 RepID=UPI00262CC7CF|nr:glycosyltransferase family A protein [Winogradskyella sp.]